MSLTNKWDVDCVLNILCKQDKEIVKALKRIKVIKTETLIFEDPYYDGTQWITKKFYVTGTAKENVITIDRNTSCENATVILYHEVWHTQQDKAKLDTFEKREYDAFYYTEKWTIERELPSQGVGLRKNRVDGSIIASWQGVVEYVHQHYPIPKTIPFPVGKTLEGKTILSDGTIRSPQKGDTFPTSKPTNQPTEEYIPPHKWQCP